MTTPKINAPSIASKAELPEPSQSVLPEAHGGEVIFAQDDTQKIETINFSNNSLPANNIYKLKQAAKIAKCKTSRILHYGSTGTISIIASVPSGIDLRALDWLSGSTANRELNPEIGKSFRPEMLVLDPKDCRQIARDGETDQGDFKNGFKFDGNGTPQIFPPNSFAPIFFKGGWVWRAFREGKPENINITRDRLFLLQTELTKLIKLIEAEDNSKCQLQDDTPQNDTALNDNKQVEEQSTKLEITPPATTIQELAPANMDGGKILRPAPDTKEKTTGEVNALPGAKAERISGKVKNSAGNNSDKTRSQSTAEPWLNELPGDPKPKHFQYWYTPARYFAREIVKNDPPLKFKRPLLAEQVILKLREKSICKRGGKIPPDVGSILKALQNCKL